MVKLFIDPGHGGSDTGAIGNGIQEKHITLQIAQQIDSILKSEYENVTTLLSRTGDQTVSLSARTTAANNWGADFYLSIHVNAGGGTGFESYVYTSVATRTKTYQDEIHSEVVNATGFQNRGEKQANFHVLRESNMPALLTENGFIDNSTDANKLKNATFITQIARGHVNGLADALGLTKKTTTATPTTPATNNTQSGTLYKVQIGAFSQRENAESLAQRARNAGFDVTILTD